MQKHTILMTEPFPVLKTPLHEHIPLLISELEKQGWSVKLFYYGRRKQHCTRTEQVCGLVLNLFNFLRLLGDREIKIVQLNSAFDRPALIRDLPFALAARLAGKSILIKFHGSADDLLYDMNAFWRTWAGLLFRLVHRVGLLSIKEKQEMRAAFHAQQAKLITVKNPIPADYLEKCAELRARPVTKMVGSHNLQLAHTRAAILTAVQTRTVYVMFASRFMCKKGLFDFLEALPYVCEQHAPAGTKVHFLLAGSGPAEKQAHRRIKELKLTEQLTWLGHLPPDELQDILAATDIFVFPSHFPEGMPMALIHAMAAGNAIITTRVRFAESYLREPDNCLFVDVGKPAQLAARLMYLIKHPEVRVSMREHNRHLLENYLAPAVGREYINTYKELLTRA